MIFRQCWGYFGFLVGIAWWVWHNVHVGLPSLWHHSVSPLSHCHSVSPRWPRWYSALPDYWHCGPHSSGLESQQNRGAKHRVGQKPLFEDISGLSTAAAMLYLTLDFVLAVSQKDWSMHGKQVLCIGIIVNCVFVCSSFVSYCMV